METIGIIAEYNPFHNGHLYHIEKIKKMYPDSLLVLLVNGYFLERGEMSILTKEDKTKIALDNGIDIVLELPFTWGSQSADIFAYGAIAILNILHVKKIVFGSESNDINMLKDIASYQLNDEFNNNVKTNLKLGLNYPTALNKAGLININNPNDLLGISYIKTIIENKYNIEPICIQRTNDYHDKNSNGKIISAENIREKIKNGINVQTYTKYYNYCIKSNDELLFNILKYKILTDDNLSDYVTVDEGIENKLIKEIKNAKNMEDYIFKVKSKRYTYNRIRRMLIHILIGFKKNDNIKKIDYVKVLGFNNRGQDYLKSIHSDIIINRKISTSFINQKYEMRASLIYDLINNTNTYQFECSNKPIIKKNID